LDKKTLQNLIIKEARRDLFNGVGRIFVDQFLKETGISRKELIEALKDLKYRLHSENILLIYFRERDPKKLASQYKWEIDKEPRFIGE